MVVVDSAASVPPSQLPFTPWRGKERLPRELGPSLLGMREGEKITCHIFCLAGDNLLPLQPIKQSVIHIHVPKPLLMPIFLLEPVMVITLSITMATQPVDSP